MELFGACQTDDASLLIMEYVRDGILQNASFEDLLSFHMPRSGHRFGNGSGAGISPLPAYCPSGPETDNILLTETNNAKTTS